MYKLIDKNLVIEILAVSQSCFIFTKFIYHKDDQKKKEIIQLSNNNNIQNLVRSISLLPEILVAE